MEWCLQGLFSATGRRAYEWYSENIKTESGSLIIFEVEKDLYTAAGQAELEKRGIKTDYTAKMTAVILDYEIDSSYVYTVLFNQKYFAKEQAVEIAENIRVS